MSAVQHPVNLVNPVQKTSLRVLRALRGGGESVDGHRLDRRVATGIFFDCHRLASTWRAAVHLPCPWLHSLCPATFFFGRVRVNAPQNLCCEYKLTHSPHSRTRTSSSCRCVNPGPWERGALHPPCRKMRVRSLAIPTLRTSNSQYGRGSGKRRARRSRPTPKSPPNGESTR